MEIVQDGELIGTPVHMGMKDGALHPLKDGALHQVETDHRIANGLQIAAALLMRERRGIVDVGSAKAALEAASARLASIARLHRTLSTAHGDDEVDLGSYLTALRDEVADCVGTQIRIDARDVMLPASAAAKIGVVVSEMATNAAKHAPNPVRAPLLTVEADTNGLGEVRLRLYDDGDGFPEGFDLEEDGGVGMVVVRETIERLGGYVYVMPRFGPYLLVGAGLEIVLPPRRRHA